MRRIVSVALVVTGFFIAVTGIWNFSHRLVNHFHPVMLSGRLSLLFCVLSMYG